MTQNHKSAGLRTFAALFLMVAAQTPYVFTGLARAQTVVTRIGVGCGVSEEKFNALRSVQSDPSLSYLDELTSELRIRKELLSETVGCAIQEALSLQSTLKTTSVNDQEIKSAQTQLEDRLADALNYYGLQKAKIPDLGIQGSKDFAASLQAWREGTYAPIAKEASNVIIWAGNQGLIATAENRMNQMGHTMELLNLVGNTDLTTLWNDAQESFKTTLDINQKARDALRVIGDAKQTLDLIKSSLDALALTYQKLFELNNRLVNNPTGSNK